MIKISTVEMTNQIVKGRLWGLKLGIIVGAIVGICGGMVIGIVLGGAQ